MWLNFIQLYCFLLRSSSSLRQSSLFSSYFNVIFYVNSINFFFFIIAITEWKLIPMNSFDWKSICNQTIDDYIVLLLMFTFFAMINIMLFILECGGNAYKVHKRKAECCAASVFQWTNRVRSPFRRQTVNELRYLTIIMYPYWAWVYMFIRKWKNISVLNGFNRTQNWSRLVIMNQNFKKWAQSKVFIIKTIYTEFTHTFTNCNNH